MKKVGFIGLGIMGHHMASNLVVSYRITCNNGNQRTLINP